MPTIILLIKKLDTKRLNDMQSHRVGTGGARFALTQSASLFFCFSVLKMYVNVSECMYVYHVYACACGRQKVPDLLKLELDR